MCQELLLRCQSHPNDARRAATDRTNEDERWSIPLADIVVDAEVRQTADEALASGWWSMGPRVEAFERAFAEHLGAAHAVAVSSGTAALHLALAAAGIGRGDEVLLASLNFVAAANTILHVGATPIFCDICGDDDLTLNPADVENAIGPKTTAVVVMHYGGNACRMDELMTLAAAHDLLVIEDAAHAPGATFRGRMCGTIGDIGCFSFFANKNLPVGEGGMVVTDDDELARRIRLLRSHGMTTLTWDRHRGHAHTYDVVAPGFNYRLDEVRAAIGLLQLRRLEDENQARSRLVAAYREVLAERPDITMPFPPREGDTAACHLAVAVFASETLRDRVRAALEEARIQTSVHYPPIHQFSHYSSLNDRTLVRTDDIAARLLTLPLYGRLSSKEVEQITSVVLHALDRS
jgi:dTDP-4-amino-4,6-dideoxygalactose transaminase